MRAGRPLEINYNEGWNVYNANRLTHGQLLYPVRFGWTSVNYPMLSFAVMAGLHRVTHDFLFTARILSILSLLVGAVFLGLIVRSLGGSRQASVFAGLFCWTCFCSFGESYVGADDPQLFAQAVFLGALLVYVRHRRSLPGLFAAALIFVVALSLKHNPIDIPVAVFLDLLLTSVFLAGWFAVWGCVFLAVAVWANTHFGGPFFLAQMLTPRRYLPIKVPFQLMNMLGPVLVPLSLGVFAGVNQWQRPDRRIALLLLGTAVVIGGYFSGGSGVASNALFTSLLALSILVGFFLDDPTLAGTLRLRPAVVAWAPALCFLWLLIPLGLSGNWNPVARWKEMQVKQAFFARDVAFLRARPGPALCESLLECYAAGKPFVFDPFNATRLVWFGKLNAREITDGLRDGRFAVVQTDAPLERGDDIQQERFAPEIQHAILSAYVRQVSERHGHGTAVEAGANSTLYVPRAKK